MTLIKANTIQDVRNYYGKKYTKIFNALENVNATNFEIDTGCYGYLELGCDIKNYHIKMNIGIDNFFHTWCKNKEYPFTETTRNVWTNQHNLADYLISL